MPSEHSQRVLSVPIRRFIDLLSVEEREKLSTREFRRLFWEQGVPVFRRGLRVGMIAGTIPARVPVAA